MQRLILILCLALPIVIVGSILPNPPENQIARRIAQKSSETTNDHGLGSEENQEHAKKHTIFSSLRKRLMARHRQLHRQPSSEDHSQQSQEDQQYYQLQNKQPYMHQRVQHQNSEEQEDNQSSQEYNHSEQQQSQEDQHYQPQEQHQNSQEQYYYKRNQAQKYYQPQYQYPDSQEQQYYQPQGQYQRSQKQQMYYQPQQQYRRQSQQYYQPQGQYIRNQEQDDRLQRQLLQELPYNQWHHEWALPVQRYVRENQQYYIPSTYNHGITKMIRKHKVNEHGNVVTSKAMWLTIMPKDNRNMDNDKLFDEAYQSMKEATNEEKREFHESVMAAFVENEELQLNATQLLKQHQYPVEEHVVRTDDGYYLSLIRIPSRSNVQKNEVVFLMHGIFGSADDWLVTGPGKSLAYLLADAGYDVYLGNARGSKYSRRHASKHPAQNDFWEFSVDDIALHDLPAMINHALRTSQQQKLYYVGHSLGATEIFALAASRPEYNDKIKMVYAMAPIVYAAHAKSPFVKIIASQDAENVHDQIGNGQFKPTPEFLHSAGGELCEKIIGCKKVCSTPVFAVTGVNLQQLEPALVPAILEHTDTSSVRVLKQIAQWKNTGEFRRYDYGVNVNEQVYGMRVPPTYELEAVRMPVTVYYGEQDWLAQPEDVQTLQQRLPNVADSYKVPEQYFGHMDYQYSKNAPEYVYQRILKSMEQHNA